MMTPSTPKFVVEKIAPDLGRVRVFGDIDAQTLSEIMTESEQLMLGVDSYISILDVTELGSVSPEARVLAKEVPRRMPALRAQIAIGGGFVQRLVMKLLFVAMNIVSKNPISFHFCADEAEAMKIVNKLRTTLRNEPNDE